MRRKTRTFNIIMDNKYSEEFIVHAKTVREAKKKALARYKRKMTMRSVNFYVDEYDEDGWLK